jgi:hypothetical protein
LSRYCIGTEAGILQSVMNRFMNGQDMLAMARLGDLADLINLNITVDVATKARKGSTRGQYQ